MRTGSGNDYVVGNETSNIIETSSGDDIIFAGESDIINPGPGNNIIDLSQDLDAPDTIIIDFLDTAQSFNTVYGFSPGELGDQLLFENIPMNQIKFLPLVDILNVPSGIISNGLTRIFGGNLDKANHISEELSTGGSLDSLLLVENESAIILTAATQETGEEQNIYIATRRSDNLEVNQILKFVGNYLDIDTWSADNFII